MFAVCVVFESEFDLSYIPAKYDTAVPPNDAEDAIAVAVVLSFSGNHVTDKSAGAAIVILQAMPLNSVPIITSLDRDKSACKHIPKTERM